MSPIEMLEDELDRYLWLEADGDHRHPGVRLRALLMLSVADENRRQSLVQYISEVGFLPVADRFNLVTGQASISSESIARALGVTPLTMISLFNDFLELDVADRLGFTYEAVFPHEGIECMLH